MIALWVGGWFVLVGDELFEVDVAGRKLSRGYEGSSQLVCQSESEWKNSVVCVGEEKRSAWNRCKDLASHAPSSLGMQTSPARAFRLDFFSADHIPLNLHSSSTLYYTPPQPQSPPQCASQPN